MTAAILLLVLGLGLIVAEIFFPSLGMLAVLATAAVVGAIAMAFQESSTAGVNFLIATAVLVPGVILLGFKLFPKSPFGKKMVAGGLSFESTASLDPRDLVLLDKEGTIESDCRPAGMARLDGRRVDVVTRGEWLAAGTQVKVVEVQGNRVVVTRSETRA
ncbi:MAG: serine protease [Planctomycetes bacterium]|nr:serine protease [Planctomycetota bacterium]